MNQDEPSESNINASQPSYLMDFEDEHSVQFMEPLQSESYFSSFQNSEQSGFIRRRRRGRGRGRVRGAQNHRKRGSSMNMVERYFVLSQAQDKYTCRLCLSTFPKTQKANSQMLTHILAELKEAKQLKFQNGIQENSHDVDSVRSRGRYKKMGKNQQIWVNSALDDQGSRQSGKKIYEKKGLVKKYGVQGSSSMLKSNELFGRPSQFYEMIFSRLPLHWTQLEIFNHMSEQFEIPRPQIPVIMKRYFWKYARDYSNLLDTIKLNRNATIIENCLGSMVRNVIIRTILMKEKFIRYKDCLGFYYFPNPTDEQGLISIIYMLGQDRNFQPVLLGLILILDENTQSFKIMFDSLFEHVKFIPEQIVICGPNNLKNACDEVLHQKLTRNDAQYSSLKSASNCIFLKEIVIRIKNEKSILTELKDLLDSIMENSGSQTSFVGFMLTESFIQKVKQLTPDVIGIKSGLQQFLIDCFQNQVSETELNMENQITDKEDKGLLKMRAFSRIIEIKQINDIKKKTSKQIFLKFALIFVYGCFYLRIMVRNRYEMLVQEIADEQIWFSKSPNKISYNVDRNLWVCDCGLAPLIGLPCPHLIKVLTTYSFSLRDYINQRWYLKSSVIEDALPNPVAEKHRKVSQQALIRQLSVIRNDFSLNQYSFLENLWS